jgi:polar amino acid transport system substrate-binding protein
MEDFMNLRNICISIGICVCLISKVAAEETIRITNGEWPPYLSEQLKFYGVASRIVTDAFALEGVTVTYGFFPWKRALVLAQEGDWDASAVWLWSEERAENFYISDPVIKSTYVFFHLKSSPFEWEVINDLKGRRIGATLGYNYGEQFEQAEKNGAIEVDRVPEDEVNFKKLLAGRIDVFPMDKEVGYTMLRKLFKPEEIELFTHHPTPLRADPLHLLLSKKVEKNKRLIELFNKGLKRLQESGKIDQYLEGVQKNDY